MHLSLIFCFALALFFSPGIAAQQNTTLAACCTAPAEGRCTGSMSCTACSDCSECAHCNSGGRCGVCAYRKPGANRSSHTPNNPLPLLSNGDYQLPDDPNSRYYLRRLQVDAPQLNLRAGPGTDHDVLYRLPQHTLLVFLAQYGEWLKVQVVANGQIGFVHYDFVVLEN